MHSHSSTQRFNTCPYAYKLSKLDGLVRTAYQLESNDREWAIAGHRGLHAYYTGGNPVAAFSAAYPTDLDPIEKVWTREGGIRTLEAYAERYDLARDQWDILEAELDNRVEGEDEASEGHVIIDLVTRHRSSGSVYFWDHKFKHKLNQFTGRQYELDSQLSRYASYVQTKYGECAGAIVNIICPGYRQRAYKGEPAGWHFRFEQNVYNRSKDQIEVWRREQAVWEAAIEQCQRVGHFPRHYGWQCGRCEFYDVCFAEREGGDSSSVRDAMYGGLQSGQDMSIEIEEAV